MIIVWRHKNVFPTISPQHIYQRRIKLYEANKNKTKLVDTPGTCTRTCTLLRFDIDDVTTPL